MGSWRVGRKVGRTIYDGDTLIGVMDTPELAARVVAAVNADSRSPAAPPPLGPICFCEGAIHDITCQVFKAERYAARLGAGTPRGDE